MFAMTQFRVERNRYGTMWIFHTPMLGFGNERCVCMRHWDSKTQTWA